MRLSVNLNQDYKSFSSDFKFNFEGDLLIFSGVNGSGKTQFLEIVNGNSFSDKNLKIESSVMLNDIAVMSSEITYRSFKETIPNFPGPQSFSNSRSQVWNHYQKHRLNENVDELKDFQQSTNKAKDLLVKEFGREKYESGRITQEEINNSKKLNNFIWRNDDIFTNFISDIFYIYAWKRLMLEAGKGSGFLIEKTAPWELLNNLFRELDFEYRFKSEYEINPLTQGLNEQPSLYEINSKGEINENNSRILSDLSDGEKAIVALTFGSFTENLKEEKHKILLLDEFDATLNPSLLEKFYKVIDKYFIKQGVMVILATHSISSISTAPEYASFYEFFKSKHSKRILPVNRSEYEEVKVTNNVFWAKIANQEDRIRRLEKENESLQSLKRLSKPVLAVEDKINYIYKIAWLKLNDISFKTNVSDINSKFEEHAAFSIWSPEAAGALAGYLAMNNTEMEQHRKIFGLFDFDREGTEKFYLLKRKNNWDDRILGEKNKCLYKKRGQHPCFYALLIPIPSDLMHLTSDIKNGKYENFVELENLLPSEFLVDNDFCETQTVLDKTYLKIKKDSKNTLWKKSSELGVESFSNFKPLFKFVENRI